MNQLWYIYLMVFYKQMEWNQFVLLYNLDEFQKHTVKFKKKQKRVLTIIISLSSKAYEANQCWNNSGKWLLTGWDS